MIQTSAEVGNVLRSGGAVVALESTVLAHGLPFPRNLEVGLALEDEVRSQGATPATVAVLGGVPRVGLNAIELERIAAGKDVLKVSTRDLPVAVARRVDAATTVAATMWLSARAGINVFATGGIGGATPGALLLCVPPPDDKAVDPEEVERYVADALASAKAAGVGGKALTPFLLAEMARLSESKTIETNVALLRNNVRVAARVAVAMVHA